MGPAEWVFSSPRHCRGSSKEALREFVNSMMTCFVHDIVFMKVPAHLCLNRLIIRQIRRGGTEDFSTAKVAFDDAFVPEDLASSQNQKCDDTQSLCW